MLKNILFKCLTIIGFGLTAQTFQVTYGFPNVDPTTGTSDPGPFPSAIGIQPGAFLANGVSAAPSASGRFSFTGWPTGASNGDNNFGNFTGVLSPMSFYRFTIRVNSGYTLSVNSIEFSVRRSGTGPRNYAVRCNKDNFSGNLAANTGTNTRLSVIPTDVFFWKYDSISTSNDQYGNLIAAGSSLQQITDSVTFHFYAWNAESAGGSFSIDNVKVTGLVKNAADTSALSLQKISNDENKVIVYPNPSGNEEIFILGKNIKLVQLLAPSGKILFSRPVTNEEKIRINTEHLEEGMYLLGIFQPEGVIMRKIIVP